MLHLALAIFSKRAPSLLCIILSPLYRNQHFIKNPSVFKDITLFHIIFLFMSALLTHGQLKKLDIQVGHDVIPRLPLNFFLSDFSGFILTELYSMYCKQTECGKRIGFFVVVCACGGSGFYGEMLTTHIFQTLCTIF